MPLTVLPATLERWDDVQLVLNPACQCQYWRMGSSGYERSTPLERQNSLREQLVGDPPPGLVAYLDDEPVGWCGFAPRQRAERLRRSRTIPVIDDLPVWAIYCFSVRVGFRRQGVARQLLGALVDYARQAGVPALEAYPVDTGGTRIHATAAYVGTRHMFEAAGFEAVIATDARSDHRVRWLMRRRLMPARER